MSDDLLLDGYTEFLAARKDRASPPERLLQFGDRTAVQATALPTEDFMFKMLSEDSVRELINDTNRVIYYIDCLRAWDHVLAGRTDQERLEIRYEQVEPIVLCAVDSPYKIPNRIIFAAGVLLDVPCLVHPEAHVALPANEKIGYKTLANLRASHAGVDALLTLIEKVDGPTYRKGTGNFRRVHHHRMPPSIEFGIRSFVTRGEVGSKSRSWGLGGHAPLKLARLAEALDAEHALLCSAVEGYWQFVLVQARLRGLTSGTLGVP